MALKCYAMYAFEKRLVLSIFFTMLTFRDDFVPSGNEFRRTGAADEKERPPYITYNT